MPDLTIYLTTDDNQTQILLGQYINSEALSAEQSAADAAASAAQAASAATTVVNSLALLKTNNLSDVTSATTALTNLGGAPLDSPNFTGTPNVPGYLTSANAASTYLTQANATANYAPLNSPAFTGTPTAPTVGVVANSTTIATTAWARLLLASPGTIGNTAPNTGAFTTLSTTGAYTPSQTAGIVGTTTNNNVSAGSVGEYISSTVLVGSAVPLTTGTATTITSISLTAGDWDIWGNVVVLTASGTTITLVVSSYNTTASTLPTPPNNGWYTQWNGSVAGALSHAPSGGKARVSLSATTTIYLIGQANFTGSTASGYGFLGARRRR
jgi:hypothetical protein